MEYTEYRSHLEATARGQVSLRVELKPHNTYYIIPCVGETFKGSTFFLQVLSEHKTILEWVNKYMELIFNIINCPKNIQKFIYFRDYEQDIYAPSIADMVWWKWNYILNFNININ